MKVKIEKRIERDCLSAPGRPLRRAPLSGALKHMKPGHAELGRGGLRVERAMRGRNGFECSRMGGRALWLRTHERWASGSSQGQERWQGLDYEDLVTGLDFLISLMQSCRSGFK